MLGEQIGQPVPVTPLAGFEHLHVLLVGHRDRCPPGVTDVALGDPPQSPNRALDQRGCPQCQQSPVTPAVNGACSAVTVTGVPPDRATFFSAASVVDT